MIPIPKIRNIQQGNELTFHLLVGLVKFNTGAVKGNVIGHLTTTKLIKFPILKTEKNPAFRTGNSPEGIESN